MSTNVTLTGTLGRDPELRFTPSGKAVATMSVVTSKSVKNDDGKWENHEETWWRVSAWDQLAENVVETLQKGDPVIIVGRSFMEQYTDKDGNERQVLKVNAFNIGVDLRRRSAQVNRVQREKSASTATYSSESWPSEPQFEDEPPF